MSGDLPPLRMLHPASSLSSAKITKYDRLTTTELIDSLKPGGSEALRARPDGTILNGHHRISILQNRGVDVNKLPREVVARDDLAGAAEV